MSGFARKAAAPTFAERLYAAAAGLAFPIVAGGARVARVSPSNLAERRGFLPAATGPLYWFHGASAGEIAGAVRLATLLRSAGYDFTPAFTAANRAGVEAARRAAGARSVVAIAPWDAPAWIRRAFDRWQPRALFLIETEIWPRMILEASRRGVPVFSVSGRIYPRDLLGYRLIRPLLGTVLRRLTAVLAQDETEAERFRHLGADPTRCFVAGNLKHASAGGGGPSLELARELGCDRKRPLVICASIHGDELSLLFEALEQVCGDDTGIVVAPRHLRDLSRIEAEASRRGWDVARRSQEPGRKAWKVLAVDSIGELPEICALGAVTIVGGGFGNHGGHNPAEPLRRGTPILFGPNFENFKRDADRIVTATPEARVRTAPELAGRLAHWLRDPAERERIQRLQLETLPDPELLAQRYVSILSIWLERLVGDQ